MRRNQSREYVPMIIKSSNNKLQRPDVASAGRILQKDQNNNSMKHAAYTTPQRGPEVQEPKSANVIGSSQLESTFTRPT